MKRRTPAAAVADIEAVYRERLRQFHRVATAILGNAEEAEDVVQDAFASALRSLSDYRRDGPLEAWLWRIVVNAARHRFRLRRPEDVRDDFVQDAPADDVNSVRSALRLLPERQRLALFLRYYADLDYLTISRVMGVSAGTVASTLSQAHVALRANLQEVLC